MRMLSDVAWIILLVITPWWLFEKFSMPACKRAVAKRWEALDDAVSLAT